MSAVFWYAGWCMLSFVVAFLGPRLVKRVWYTGRALDVLSREQRAGESLYDTVESLAGDAHNWRGMVAQDPVVSFAQADGRLNRSGQKVVAFDARKGITSIVDAQPLPVNGSGPALWPMIIAELGDSETDRLLAADMLARHEFGVAKYGVPLVASNGRDHLVDAYQEALDGVVYLRAAFDDDANVRHEQHKIRVLGVISDMKTDRSRLHQIYIDQLDLAKEIRELILARDGK